MTELTRHFAPMELFNSTLYASNVYINLFAFLEFLLWTIHTLYIPSIHRSINQSVDRLSLQIVPFDKTKGREGCVGLSSEGREGCVGLSSKGREGV